MDPSQIITEFEERSRSAGKYREIAALSLVVSVILIAVYEINRAQRGAWSGAVLAGAVVLAAAACFLAILSFLNLRCPKCGRVLGQIFGAAYCPSCGAALTSDAPPAPEAGESPVPQTEGKMVRRRGSAVRTRGRAWTPKDVTSGDAAFPGETYPKNIRMFTTPDEMELTKRFIRLIDLDNQNEQTRDNNLLPGGPPVKPAGLPRPSANADIRSPKSRSSWRTYENKESDGRGLLGRLIGRIRGG
jgi:uncharacterized Zn finger protein (UPF0148 family)